MGLLRFNTTNRFHSQLFSKEQLQCGIPFQELLKWKHVTAKQKIKLHLLLLRFPEDIFRPEFGKIFGAPGNLNNIAHFHSINPKQ